MRRERPLLVIGNHNYSSWSLRAWLFLSAIGLEFDLERLALDTQEHADQIGELSPSGRVPVLYIGDEVIWDSLAICQEMADRCAPRHGYPSDPCSRARARSTVAEMHSGFPALRAALPMNCRATGRRVELSEAVRGDIDRVCELWRDNRTAHAEQGPWQFGTFGIADAYYAPVVSRFATYGVEVGEVERGYMSTVLSHPAMQRWLELARAESEVIGHEEVGVPEPY